MVGNRSFPTKENSYFPGCNAVRFLPVGCLIEVTDKKELLGLLFDVFGQTLHAIWKKKSCFVMFSPWLNDWVKERRVQTVCLWGKINMKFLHCFGAGMGSVYLQSPFSNFSEKKHSAAIYFPLLLQCKTNTYRNDKS